MTVISSAPKFTFQFSPSTNPLSTPSYVDISGYTLDFQCRYGRQFELDRMEAGTASFTLDNTDRRFDPTNSSGPYYPNLIPIRKYQVKVPNVLPVDAGSPLATSGNEITDVTRAGNDGDGLPTPGGFGIYKGSTNAALFSGTLSAFLAFQGATLTVDSTHILFPGVPNDHVKMVTPGVTVGGGGEGLSCAGGARAVAVNGQTYTGSYWVYSISGGEKLSIGIDQFNSSGTYLSSLTGVIYTLQAGWNRLTVTATTNQSTVAKIGPTLRTAVVAQAINVWVVGQQIETGSFATPLIRTSGATASRSAAQVTAPSSLIGSTNGFIAARIITGFAKASPPSGGTGFDHIFQVGTTGNGVQVMFREASSDWRCRITDGTNSWDAAVSGPSFNTGDTITIVAYWALVNGFLKGFISINGSAFTAGTASTLTTLGTLPATFGIGNTGSGGNQIESSVRWFVCGSGIPSDVDATTFAALPNTLTTWSSTNYLNPVGDASSIMWPSTVSVSAVWPTATSSYRVPSDSYIFTGFIEQWPSKWEGPSWSEIDCTAVDGFEALSQANIQSTHASYTTSQGSNKDITYTSNAIGAGNNSITIKYTNTGSLSVTVTGIDINVGINAGVTTASSIITAVNADIIAGALVKATLASGSNGSGTPAAFGPSNLSGGTFVQELAGARIGHVLDAINWPSTDRILDTGQSQVVAAVFNASDQEPAKSHINDVENSELGYVFMNGQGYAVYHDRAHRTSATLSTVSQGVFGDRSTELEYSDLVPSFDKTYIYNYVAITPYNASIAQIATDTTSVSQYMLRTFAQSTLLVNATDALNVANYILSIYKQPSIRFASMTVQPLNDVGLWLQVLSRTIGDRVTVVRRPPDYGIVLGPPIAIDCFIESVQWNVSAGDGEVTVIYELSPTGYSPSQFTLDSGSIGTLDGTAKLGI